MRLPFKLLVALLAFGLSFGAYTFVVNAQTPPEQRGGVRPNVVSGAGVPRGTEPAQVRATGHPPEPIDPIRPIATTRGLFDRNGVLKTPAPGGVITSDDVHRR